MAWLNEKHKKIAKTLVQVILVLAVLYLLLTKLLSFFAPFLIAFLIAYIIEKPVSLLQKRFRLPRGVASAVSLAVFMVLAGGLIGFLFYRLFMEVWDLTKVNMGYQNILPRIQEWIDLGGAWYAGLPPEVVNTVESSLKGILSKIGDTATLGINSILNAMIKVLTSLPQSLLYTVITLVAAFFFSRDKQRISRFVYSQLPENWDSKAKGIKDDLLAALIGYVRALLIMVTITFFQILPGYIILGVKYSLFLAIATAVADFLPVLGPGTVLIPGAVIHLINGSYFQAVGFLILYMIVTVVRQFIEPRIVGGNIGLHPLVTLIFIYLGYRVFGFTGLILGPVFAILVKSLQKAGILPAWKSSE
ncbi:MAG TPA: sporulation integral membrane protein YtvI [Clostridiales bacterium]|nr:sporulation integral membrane protein YtvI [Clostridiales bacterium]